MNRGTSTEFHIAETQTQTARFSAPQSVEICRRLSCRSVGSAIARKFAKLVSLLPSYCNLIKHFLFSWS
jgi:aspartyl/asparaginyl beta-hydroxylase (cupin superfamily)